MSENLYSDDLTSEEEQLGFKRVYLSNSDSYFYGHGSIVPAVVFQFGECDMLIKFKNPLGGVEYSHQKYGRYGTSETERAEWKPTSTPVPNAGLAIRSVQSGTEASLPGTQTINPATPSMALRCPSCSHEFELTVDHVPFGQGQKCPSCEHEADIAEFNAINL